jgi:hypothetical protein
VIRPQFNKFQALMPYTFLLLLLTLAAVVHQPHALTSPEAHQLWIVQDAEPLPGISQPRMLLRILLTNTRQLLDRSLESGQPPLYPALLDVWLLAAGESLVAARLLSLFAVLLAVALISAVVRRRLKDNTLLHGRLVSFWLVLIASLLPATVLLARSVEPGGLLLALSALNLWLLLRWLQEPSVPRSLLYALSLALALYTHLFAVLLIGFGGLIQATRLLQGQRVRGSIDWERLWVRSFTFGILRWMLSAALALLLYAPFLLFAEPPTRTTDVSPLLWALTLPWLVGFIGVEVVKRLVKWRPVQQLSAGGLGLVSTAALTLVLLSGFISLTPPVTNWDNAVALITQSRQPLEPLILAYAPDSPPAYYADRTSLRAGIALDVGWREFTPDEQQALLDKLDPAQAIWLVMPVDSLAYSIWIEMLEAQGRTRTARSGVEGMSIEQWTPASTSN